MNYFEEAWAKLCPDMKTCSVCGKSYPIKDEATHWLHDHIREMWLDPATGPIDRGVAKPEVTNPRFGEVVSFGMGGRELDI